MEGNEDYGLTRTAIASKQWHKNNSNAATNFLGFTSWKEAVLVTHELYGVLPPTEAVYQKYCIFEFEKYIMGYLRIHARMIVYAILIMWGNNRGCIGRLINEAVKKISSTGEHISILGNKHFEETCLHQYKNEGREKCCAVPDGKDFKIYTTLKNTIFTIALCSDKVHTSVVWCISWSTLQGLSFEHTNSFLGRISEKKLVELWGPCLKNAHLDCTCCLIAASLARPGLIQTWIERRPQSFSADKISSRQVKYLLIEGFANCDTHVRLHSWWQQKRRVSEMSSQMISSCSLVQWTINDT